MFEPVRYIKNTFSLIFEKNEKIRQMAKIFEDKLSDKYLPPQINPISDEFPPEIPRIIFSSKSGFSKIYISQTNLSLSVKYSEDWQVDIKRGVEYFGLRIPRFLELLNNNNFKICYSGFNSISRIKCLASLNDTLASLTSVYFNKCHGDIDMALRFSKLIDNKFYSNIEVKNYKLWNDNNIINTSKTSSAKIKEVGIQFSHDFNDRYLYNEVSDYKFDENNCNEIVKKGIQIIDDESQKFFLRS